MPTIFGARWLHCLFALFCLLMSALNEAHRCLDQADRRLDSNEQSRHTSVRMSSGLQILIDEKPSERKCR